ncbi:MAG: hypothetical protein C7N14_06345 [Bacteroidetes bacterium]|jgi:hypothetical protein|nr:MAG: hypothetical protein C7N14_06345 [Bacteroidota bacterium]
MASRDRKPYEVATFLDQEILDEMQENQVNGLRAILDITAPDDSIIRVSDRNTYVGEHFYEARTKFPEINRTVGDWLGSNLVFSEIDFVISNVDGRYNHLLPAGDDFSDWKGRPVELKIGLGEIEESYISVFKGIVSNEGGFSRTVANFRIRARNDLARVNVAFPTQVFNIAQYPEAEESLFGDLIPHVFGDWTESVTQNAASLPAIVTNGADIFVTNEQIDVEISNGSPAVFTKERHLLKAGDKIALSTDGTLPNGLNEQDYFVRNILSDDTFTVSATLGGSEIDTTTDGSGIHRLRRAEDGDYRNVKLTISYNALESIDTNNIYLLRGDLAYRIPTANIINIGAGFRTFEIIQNLPGFSIGENPWTFASSDEFLLKAKGEIIDPGYNDNPVSLAKFILINYGGLNENDFDFSWIFYRDKTSVSITKARAYINQQQDAMEYAISIMEQVALEPFINRDLKFSINSLQFDDWISGEPRDVTITINSPATFLSQNHRLKPFDKIILDTNGQLPSGLVPGEYFVASVTSANTFTVSETVNGPEIGTGFPVGFGDHTIQKTPFRVRNWDVQRETFNPQVDQRNNFNRARAIYNFLPNLNENAFTSSYYRNQNAINQQGQSETKALIYPNLYQRSRVEFFLVETLKLTSAFREVVSFTATPRAFLLDVGDFINIDVKIGSSIFEDVPFMIRDIGYDPATLKIKISGWAMTMIPFPNYEPNYAGTVGGFNATIIEET